MKARWAESKILDGVINIKLKSWRDFSPFVSEEMLPYKEYVWRGQRRSDWKLEPTLDRILRKLNRKGDSKFAEEHLSRFKYASRGRRADLRISLDGNEDDWWAVGQHHGLATPLLDWSRSPFTAAYFAFEEEDDDDNKLRAIWALDQEGVENLVTEIIKKATDDANNLKLEFIEPMALDTPRLINQAALFTKAPYGVDVEQWVKKAFKGEREYWRLIKVTCPTEDRDECLRTLHRMNISHLSLFPDLDGSSRYCNLHLGVEKY